MMLPLAVPCLPNQACYSSHACKSEENEVEVTAMAAKFVKIRTVSHSLDDFTLQITGGVY